jgi:hypothetical protein
MGSGASSSDSSESSWTGGTGWVDAAVDFGWDAGVERGSEASGGEEETGWRGTGERWERGRGCEEGMLSRVSWVGVGRGVVSSMEESPARFRVSVMSSTAETYWSSVSGLLISFASASARGLSGELTEFSSTEELIGTGAFPRKERVVVTTTAILGACLAASLPNWRTFLPVGLLPVSGVAEGVGWSLDDRRTLEVFTSSAPMPSSPWLSSTWPEAFAWSGLK